MKPPAGTLIKSGDSDVLGLVNYWVMNTGLGDTLYDYAPDKPWLERNHGTIHGANWIRGSDGPTLGFTGSQFVDCGNGDSFDFTTENFMIFCRFKTSTSGTFRVLAGNFNTFGPFKDRGYILFIFTDNRAYFSIGNGSIVINVSSLVEVNDGKEHFLVGMRVGPTGAETLLLLLDGVIVNTGNASNLNITSGNNFNIGSMPAGGNYHNGTISLVGVYRNIESVNKAQRLYVNPYNMFFRPYPMIFFAPVAEVIDLHRPRINNLTPEHQAVSLKPKRTLKWLH